MAEGVDIKRDLAVEWGSEMSEPTLKRKIEVALVWAIAGTAAWCLVVWIAAGVVATPES